MNKPEIKFNKTGYEIRTDVLGMAKDLAVNEFQAKFGEWEMSVTKDKDGNVVHKVDMPDFPGLDIILANAEKLYGFVNKGK
jgi:hypothetical protein